MAMTDKELKEYQDFVNRANSIQKVRDTLVRRSPVGSAAVGLRETYSQAGKELTEASRQPSFAGRTGATVGALARMPGRFIGTTAADMYDTAERAYGAGADTLGRFGRAALTGSETKTPATGTQTSAAVTRTPAPVPPASGTEDFVERKEGQADMSPVTPQAFRQQGSAIPARNVITDSQGNRTFIDPETGNPRTISASGQDVTGQRRQDVTGQRSQPLARDADSSAAVPAPSAYSQRVRVPQQGPFSPDYSSPPSSPQSLSDIAASARTVGDLVRIRPLMRAAEADKNVSLRQQQIDQEALSGNQDRLLRREQVSQSARQAAEDVGLRRQQLEQTGAYQQGELGLKKEELTAKTAETGAERSAEAARQERLNAALNIYDDPAAPPEAKQRAQRIIEANQGKASFDLGEKPMTQADAQKSLQDTWRAVAGNDTPLDPSSVEQLQGVAQANPAAWKAVHGNASPVQVQKYNALSRLQPADIVKDPVISALIKKSGGGESPEEARIILEELIRKQRGF